MASLSKRLAEELRSECAHAFEEIMARKSKTDYRQLASLVAESEGVDPVHLQSAIHLLGRWGNAKAVPDLVALVPRLAADERGTINLVDALGRLGGEGALQAVLQCQGHESPDVRRFVATALYRIHTDQALEGLSAMARSDADGFVRTKARKLLQQDR